MKNHQRKAAYYLIALFSAAVLVISSSTSFAFFYNFFDGLIPPALLGQEVSALISGIVGVLLFDGACVVWLYAYLRDAETADQRAVSMVMVLITFIGGTAASVAHIALSAAEFGVDPETAATIGNLSIVAVIVGVVANFGAVQLYRSSTIEVKEAIREADREDEIQKVREGNEKELDQMVASKAKAALSEVSGVLAIEQTHLIVEDFRKKEAARYGIDYTPLPFMPAIGGGDGSSQPASPSFQSDNDWYVSLGRRLAEEAAAAGLTEEQFIQARGRDINDTPQRPT